MSDPSPTPSPDSPQRFRRLRTKTWNLSKLYALVLPSSLIILLIGYYPKIDVVIKSMYRWVPGEVEEFIGFKNFVDAFNDPLFWQSFQLIFILLIANLFKMWPGIFAAVALHRLSNERTRYVFQVLFVIPMVIPSMVWLLIWKSFYDPDFGVFNRILNASGIMRFLNWLDGTADMPGLMPRLAWALDPRAHPESAMREAFGFMPHIVEPLFGGSWGLILVACFFLTLSGHGTDPVKRIGAGGLLVATSLIPFLVIDLPRILEMGPNPAVSFMGLLCFVGLMVGLLLVMGPRWVLWMFMMLGGLYAFRLNYALLFVHTVLALVVSEIIRATMERFSAEASLKTLGTLLFLAGAFFVFFGEIWTAPTGQFEFGTPAWLGSQDLVIPALLFWGFPWVGTMGVLIYLAGLQQIPQDVYEAAEIDGIGPVGMLFRIELPLILTQVRINLIFMTITTLTAYEMFLILLGPTGGPGNRGMVPGLYMFSKAFIDGQFGYACALGMVLFFIILGLTVIYNKYVKVDK